MASITYMTRNTVWHQSRTDATTTNLKRRYPSKPIIAVAYTSLLIPRDAKSRDGYNMESQLNPGLRTLLTELKEKGAILVLYTGTGTNVRRNIDRLGLQDLFSHVVKGRRDGSLNDLDIEAQVLNALGVNLFITPREGLFDSCSANFKTVGASVAIDREGIENFRIGESLTSNLRALNL